MSKVKERAVRERQIREIKILNQKCLQRCSTNPPQKCRVWHIDSHTEFAGWYENDVTLQFIFGNLSWPQMYVCTNMNRIILYNFRHSQNVQKKSSHKLAHATASPHAHLHTQSHTHSHTHTRTHTHSVTHWHTQTHTHTCTRIRDFHTHRRWMRPPHPSCGLCRAILQLSSWRRPCTPRDSASSRIAVSCLHIHNIVRRRRVSPYHVTVLHSGMIVCAQALRILSSHWQHPCSHAPRDGSDAQLRSRHALGRVAVTKTFDKNVNKTVCDPPDISGLLKACM